jgi:NOL1/NOP2/fmu family ribosome biogenesis protein
VSVNDLRRERDVEPVEKGDDVYLSVNLAPIGSAKLNGETKVTE